MPLTPGLHEVTIIGNGIKTLGDKQAAYCDFESADGTTGQFVIWFTEKAAKLAVVQLRKCGFDPATMDLDALIEEPTLLAGNRIEIMAEPHDRGMRYSIPLNVKPDAKTVKSLQSMLRSAAPARDAEQDELPF